MMNVFRSTSQKRSGKESVPGAAAYLSAYRIGCILAVLTSEVDPITDAPLILLSRSAPPGTEIGIDM